MIFKKFNIATTLQLGILIIVCALTGSPSYGNGNIGNGISYSNTVDRSPIPIGKEGLIKVASVDMNLDNAADVLVQFTSMLAVDSGKGCPCSLRVLLQVDDQEPISVKRLNIGSPAVQSVDEYEHDRQSADGSFVYSLAAGNHTISLLYWQVTGTSELLEVFYPNLQAIAFSTEK